MLNKHFEAPVQVLAGLLLVLDRIKGEGMKPTGRIFKVILAMLLVGSVVVNNTVAFGGGSRNLSGEKEKPKETTKTLAWGTRIERNSLNPELEISNIIIFQSGYGQLFFTDKSETGGKKSRPKRSPVKYPVVRGPWGIDRNAFAIDQQYQGTPLQHTGLKYLKLFLIANIIRTPDIAGARNDLIPRPFNDWGIKMKMSDSSIGISLNHDW